MAKKKVKKATQKKAKKATVPKQAASAEEKVMGFRAGTQAARMYQLLSDGKARSVAEIHKVIQDTTRSHAKMACSTSCASGATRRVNSTSS